MAHEQELTILLGKHTDLRMQRYAHRVADVYSGKIIENDDEIKAGGPLLSFGGDHTAQRAVRAIIKGGINRPIGVIEAGTNNVLHRSWNDEKGGMELADFITRAREGDDFFRFQFSPGLIGRRLFNVDAGVGGFEIKAGHVSKMFRDLPRSIRPKLSSFVAAVATVLDLKVRHPLEIFSNAPFIGKRRVFPEQKLGSSTITHAFIDDDDPFRSKVKLAATLYCWQREIQPPPGVLTTRQIAQHELKGPFTHVWTDGDTHINSIEGSILVKRADEQVTVVPILNHQ
ncbi:hypothetical protein HY345_00115 [Candidatus Microgenomates bacterium]|nr:hypothetical protein [Candidatus Microgenomates bacterium]